MVLSQSGVTLQDVDSFDFGLYNKDINKRLAQQILLYNKEYELTVLKRITDTVILYEFPRGIALIDTLRGTILYYVEHKVEYIKLINHTALTQIAVWSNKNRIESKGMPEYTFLTYLFPITKVIMVESNETWDGKHFWFRMLASVLHYGNMYVYYINFDTKEVVLVISIQQFEYLLKQKQPWGRDPSRRQQRFVISEILL